MNYFSALILGLLQGITEFLPVSSSGHLVIAQSIIPGFSQPGILFDVILHFATLLAVVFYFRKKITQYLNLKFIYILILGTLPAVVVGLTFKSEIEILFKSVRMVGFALLATGILNILTDKIHTENTKITPLNSLIIGVFQAIAIIPGISRSGSTIFAGVTQKIKKENAAEFSFILSIPAIMGANLLEITTSFQSGSVVNIWYLMIGFMAAFLSGIWAIRLVFKIIQKSRFEYFAYYCFILGILVLLVF